jgi:hypothetical protein
MTNTSKVGRAGAANRAGRRSSIEGTAGGSRPPVEPGGESGQSEGAGGPTSHVLPCVRVQLCRCDCAVARAILSLLDRCSGAVLSLLDRLAWVDFLGTGVTAGAPAL